MSYREIRENYKYDMDKLSEPVRIESSSLFKCPSNLPAEIVDDARRYNQ